MSSSAIPAWVLQIDRASRQAWQPLARAVWGERTNLLNGPARILGPRYLKLERCVTRHGGEGAPWHLESCGTLVMELFDRRLLQGDAATDGEPRIEIHNVFTRSLDNGDRSVKPLVRHLEIPGIALFPSDPIEGEALVVRARDTEGFSHRVLVRGKGTTADAPPDSELLAAHPFGSLYDLATAYDLAAEERDVADVRERYRRRRKSRT